MRRPFVLAPFLVVLLVLGACSSGTSSSDDSGTGTTVTAVPTTTGALEGVTVPDEFTALDARATSAAVRSRSSGPIRSTTSATTCSSRTPSRVPATLEKIDVVDGRDPAKVLASFSGKQLVDPDCPPGDCNRLRLLPSADAPDAAIPPQESRALLIDVAFDSLAQAPKAVLHHLYGTGAASPPARTPAPLDYLAAPFDISAGTPLG